jgi:hypothetical protein
LCDSSVGKAEDRASTGQIHSPYRRQLGRGVIIPPDRDVIITSNPDAILFRRRVRMSAVVCQIQHLSHFNLPHVERKSMSEARFRVVKLERQFV